MKIGIKGIIVKTLLIILVISFVLFGIVNFFTSNGSTNILKIDAQKISINQFSKFLMNKKNQIYNSNMTDKDLDFVNSSEFKRMSLSEFVSEILMNNIITSIHLQEPTQAVIDNIYNDSNFKDDNGKFDIKIFKNLLLKSNIDEQIYIKYIAIANSRLALLNLLSSFSLTNEKILNKVYNIKNQYYVVNIIEIPQKSLVFGVKKIPQENITKYYEENKTDFIIPREVVISYIEVDLTKYKNEEEAKNQLSNLEDAVLLAKNIDDLSKTFNVKKNTVTYSKNSLNLPSDLNKQILDSDVGIFSDLIYANNNIYKIYYVEKTIPEKLLNLQEATSKINEILLEIEKKKDETFLLNKLIVQFKNNDLKKVALRNDAKLLTNITLYRSNSIYPTELVKSVYETEINKFTPAYFDMTKNSYIMAYVVKKMNLLENDKEFLSLQSLQTNSKDSYNNSIISLFQNYLFRNSKININEKLLETID